MKEILGLAKFSVCNNDLYWDFNTFEEIDGRYECISAKWQGYMDDFWWTSVSPNKEVQHIKTVSGKDITLRIDFKSNEVFRILEVAE